MKIIYRKITASKNEDHEWYVVDTPIPTDPESIRRYEQDRIAREIADEEDAYDLEHEEGIYSCGSITASTLVANKKIQPGLQFNCDGHRMEVASRSGNTCIITEDWLAEDTGEPVHISEKYIIASDPGHGEFCYRPEDKKYAFNSSQPDGYSWWARLYATGADNYPWDQAYDNDYQEDVISDVGEQSELYVKFQDYIDSNVKEAVFTGSDRLDALKKLADDLNVRLDSVDIERKMMSSDDVINYLLEHNGDGCDFIVKIIDESTHDLLMGYPFKDDGYPVTGGNI